MPDGIEINPHSNGHETFKIDQQVSPRESDE